MQVAEVTALQLRGEAQERELPIVHENGAVVVGNPRAIAVAKFRELADKLESGELDAARVEWAVHLPNLVTVIRDSRGTCVRLNVTQIKEG